MSGRSDSRTDTSARLFAAARTLAVDALAAETIEALREGGVRSILLKGPALASWLYADGTLRKYDDCDLLVDPAETANAAAVLTRLGFEPLLHRGDAYTVAMAPPHAECWIRGAERADVVDLHDGLFGAHAPKEVVWQKLSSRTDQMVVAGTPVEVLDVPRRALVVALHAAANGTHGTRSIEDLERALVRADEHVWGQAARLAARIGARESFAAGLRLVPAGRALASPLGLQPPMSPEVRMHASTVPDGALFLERLRTSPGARGRAQLLGRALVPPREYMRALTPLARRGRFGLCAAYVVRLFTRVATAGTALRALRVARREVQ
ncbi:MAG: nucleotidyltransferase family protein [Thermoleophilaceae bacterium]